MSSRKKKVVPRKEGQSSYKLKNPKPVAITSVISEADQCRQMCYQLAYQMAQQELRDEGKSANPETLDAIALGTVKLCFENQPPSPGELAGLHPMMVGNPYWTKEVVSH